MNGATVDQELTRQRIESVANYDAFIDLALELGTNPEPQLFDFPFTRYRAEELAASPLVCWLRQTLRLREAAKNCSPKSQPPSGMSV